MTRLLYGALLVSATLYLTLDEGAATCLACKCGGGPNTHPVTTSADCTVGCAVFGIVCRDQLINQSTKKKLHIVPMPGQTFRAFDAWCGIGVISSGDPHIVGKLPDAMCAVVSEEDQHYTRGRFCEDSPGGLSCRFK
jgi:hypothetical protein